MPPKKTRSTGGSRSCVVIAVIVTVVVIMSLWWNAIVQVRAFNIPTPRMPVPNAHDAFVAAAGSIRDAVSVEAALTPQPGTRPLSRAQKAALVAENEPVIASLQQALNETYLAPPARSSTTLFSYYAGFRQMARLLRLKQQVEEERGDWNGAVGSGLDAMQMGAQIPHGAVMIGDLVGIACEAIGRREIWHEIDHLSAPQARAAALRLETMTANRFPLTDTFQEEKWFVLASLQQLFRQKDWQRQLTGAITINGPGQSDPSGLQSFSAQINFMLHGGPNGAMSRYANYMDAISAHARLRYGAHAPGPPIPNDPVSQMLALRWSPIEFRYVLTRTEDDLLLVSLALHACYLERGHYPQTLQELSPAYLSRVPEDLFAPSGTLRYRPQGARYLLYSVGPDRVDNGGQPAMNTAATASSSVYTRHSVQENSSGDIVAGVNE